MTGRRLLLLPVVPRASATPDAVVAAARRQDVEILFVGDADAFDEHEAAVHRRHARMVLGDLLADPGSLVAELKAERPDAIMALSEGVLHATRVLADALGLPFHSEAVVARLRDKGEQRRVLADAGVDTVRATTVVDLPSLRRVLSLSTGPVVVKPAGGAGSRDAYPVHTPRDLPAAVQPTEDDPFVVEELLVGRDCAPWGDYLSVESLVVDGEVRTLGITGKLPLAPPFRETGQFVPAVLDDAEAAEVTAVTARALTALGVRSGLAHTELKLTDRGPRIIEVNGRLGGNMAEMYRRGTGLDLIEHGVAAACGTSCDDLGDQAPPRVAALVWTTPPPAGGTLVRTEGLDAAARLAGVLSIEGSHASRSPMPPGVTTAMIHVVRLDVEDHAALLAVTRDVFSRLRYTLADESGHLSTWRPSPDGLLEPVNDREHQED